MYSEFILLEFGTNVSSVHRASGYALSHTLQSVRRKIERRSFFVEGIDGTVATTVAIEAASSIGGYQFSLREIQLAENVALLAKEVLLMVTRE